MGYSAGVTMRASSFLPKSAYERAKSSGVGETIFEQREKTVADCRGDLYPRDEAYKFGKLAVKCLTLVTPVMLIVCLSFLC